jgi:subtilisin family serine protease
VIYICNGTTSQGLACISHRSKLGLGTFTLYDHDPTGGEGVDVHIIDTSISIDHVEFESRASWSKTILQNGVDEDGNGHGTHCSGTVGSRKYGVAKAVKVLGSNGSGTMGDVVAGVLWAAEHAANKLAAAEAEYAATGKTKHKGSVANMSLGGGMSQALNDAVNRAVDSGMHFAVAAGNDNKDACSYSPAAHLVSHPPSNQCVKSNPRLSPSPGLTAARTWRKRLFRRLSRNEKLGKKPRLAENWEISPSIPPPKRLQGD